MGRWFESDRGAKKSKFGACSFFFSAWHCYEKQHLYLSVRVLRFSDGIDVHIKALFKFFYG